MSSTFDGGIKLSVFGESHGAGIGVVIDNIPSGEELDEALISAFMARRAPRTDGTSTMRREGDSFEVLSGFYNGKTTGTPLAAIIRNSDQHSGDYSEMAHLARPGHADYTGNIRYNGANDIRGGGHFSGRLTAPLVFAGAVCGQLLTHRGITTGSHIEAIHGIRDKRFDAVRVDEEQLNALKKELFPLIDTALEEPMRAEIAAARDSLDSVGGIIECAAVGVPAGIGSPMFGGVENVISRLAFGVPAVKGIEFGNGFDAASLLGSENNDPFRSDAGRVYTLTNNHGGILGGITSGMPIVFRVAVKPTPSIAREQKTIDFVTGENADISVHGRHDPCIVPRAVPVIEAVMNIALMSLIQEG